MAAVKVCLRVKSESGGVCVWINQGGSVCVVCACVRVNEVVYNL